jgi:hypothetical protein
MMSKDIKLGIGLHQKKCSGTLDNVKKTSLQNITSYLYVHYLCFTHITSICKKNP